MNNSRNLGGGGSVLHSVLLLLVIVIQHHISVAEYTFNELELATSDRARRGTERVRSRQPFGKGFFGSETIKEVPKEERRESRPMLRSSPTSSEPSPASQVQRKNGNIFAAVINTLLHKDEGAVSFFAWF